MFFSSKEYTSHDAVVVYGNSYDMSMSEIDIHSEISYSIMISSRDTVLVLMDVTKDLVSQGVHAVNAARPVDQVVLPQINPLNGICSNRAELGSAVAINHDNSYFTCLRKNYNLSLPYSHYYLLHINYFYSNKVFCFCLNRLIFIFLN